MIYSLQDKKGWPMYPHVILQGKATIKFFFSSLYKFCDGLFVPSNYQRIWNWDWRRCWYTLFSTQKFWPATMMKTSTCLTAHTVTELTTSNVTGDTAIMPLVRLFTRNDCYIVTILKLVNYDLAIYLLSALQSICIFLTDIFPLDQQAMSFYWSSCLSLSFLNIFFVLSVYLTICLPTCLSLCLFI